MNFKTKGKTRYELFSEMLQYWNKKLDGDEITKITRDNRYYAHALIDNHKNRKVEIKFNSRLLAKWSYALLLSGVFHEIGHIKHNLPYNTPAQQIKSEYLAELFSILCLKKYYPKELKEVCMYMKSKLLSKNWKRKFPNHWEAFNLLEEYK